MVFADMEGKKVANFSLARYWRDSCKLQVVSCKISSKIDADIIQIKTRSVFLFVSPQAEHFIFCEAKYFTFA